MCDTVIDLMKQGYSKANVCKSLCISRDTFYKWVHRYPQFAEAVNQGTIYAQSYWEDLAFNEFKDATKFNTSLWMFIMKTRFVKDYTDKYREYAEPRDTLREVMEQISESTYR